MTAYTDALRAEIETMAPWMDKAEARRWAARLADVSALPETSEYNMLNPAAGTSIWRLVNHPETLDRAAAINLAQTLYARILKVIE